MSDPDTDSLMRGFLYLKALIARYGTHDAAELKTLADRLVANGEFTSFRSAVEGIERSMGIPVTTPISKEAASYTTVRG